MINRLTTLSSGAWAGTIFSLRHFVYFIFTLSRLSNNSSREERNLDEHISRSVKLKAIYQVVDSIWKGCEAAASIKEFLLFAPIHHRRERQKKFREARLWPEPDVSCLWLFAYLIHQPLSNLRANSVSKWLIIPRKNAELISFGRFFNPKPNAPLKGANSFDRHDQ